MPPKTNSRKSKISTPSIIPIHNILADQDNTHCIRDCIRKLQALYRHDPDAVDKSLMAFVLQLTGLEQMVSKMNWREPIQSLNDLMEQLCEDSKENKTKSLSNGQLFLINFKSKFHKQFVARVTKLIQILISDELPIITETNLMKLIYEQLSIISRCKLRNVRAASITLVSIIVNRSCKYYQQLLEERNSKKANKIFTIIEEGYLENIVKPRTKDIDSLIREKSFEVIQQSIMVLQVEMITVKKMEDFFIPILVDNKSKVTELGLKCLIGIMEMKEKRVTTAKNLGKFCEKLIPILEQLALIPNRNGILSMNLLSCIHTKIDPKLHALKPKIISKIFQIYGYQQYHEGIKTAVNIFYQSLCTPALSSTTQPLIQHRQFFILEILHLLCSINSHKLITTILTHFFDYSKAMFSFEDMFVLLMSGYYHRDNSQIELHSSQVNILLNMIIEFNGYVRAAIKSDWKDKEIETYNKSVMINCKEIFYDKIVNSSALAHLYLRLFSSAYVPVTGPLENYVDFIVNQAMQIVSEEKYVIMANQNMNLMQQILKECVAIFSTLCISTDSKLDKIMQTFSIAKISAKPELEYLDIFKISALASKLNLCSIPEQSLAHVLLEEGTIKKSINLYTHIQQSKTRAKIVKLEIITYLYFVHKNLFTSLFLDPIESKHREYIEFRDALLEFLIEGIIENEDEIAVVKLSGFSTLCRVLRMVSASRISDLSIICYDPTDRQLQIFIAYIAQSLQLDKRDDSLADVTAMIGGIGFEAEETRQEIVKNTFAVFNQCYRIVCHSACIKFIYPLLLKPDSKSFNFSKYINELILSMAKQQIQSQNKNRFIFWRFFNEVMKQAVHRSVTNEGGEGGDGEGGEGEGEGEGGEGDGDEDKKQNKEQEVQEIIRMLVSQYFKYRKHHAPTHRALSDKLMLYIADSIDKCLNHQDYKGLAIIKMLLNKVYRRYPKEILQRLHIFYSSKIGTIDDTNVKGMKKYLEKISRSGKSKMKKEESEEKQNDNDGEGKSEDDEEDGDGKSEKGSENGSSKQEENIMVEKKRATLPNKQASTRSSTKKKSRN